MTVHALPRAAATDVCIAQLAERFGDQLSTSAAMREQHGRGEGVHELFPPDAVLFAQSTEDVAAALALCHAHGVPVVPFGVGTSLEGHVQAIGGGVTIDLSRMDAILEVNAEDLDCRVQAGVTREALNLHLRDQGLFFPLDPGANATIGGMAATRASGTNAVRYGTMREVALGLTVVTPEGEVIRTGTRARKSSAGYDLTRLYVGSEGTLGIITEIRLRLFGIPEQITAAVTQYDDLGAAVDTVVMLMQMAVPLARIELLDDVQMRACIAYSKLEGLDEKPTLFIEFHGSPAAVAEQLATVRDAVEANGGSPLRSATSLEERNRLWKARHDAYWAGRTLIPGYETIATDACVPISALTECIVAAKAEALAKGFTCPIAGHVGDGNFHVMILFDDQQPAERDKAEALAQSIARRAVSLGGTCTGEHGIGLHKLGLLVEEHGDEAVAVMRAIKHALDPKGIMNPGKTIPMVACAAS